MPLHHRPAARAFAVAGVVLSLVVGLAACGTEPSDATGRTDPEKESVNPETEWGGLDVPEQELQTEIAETFPTDHFAWPDGAVIYNTGERSANQWFIVFLAPDAAAADGLWSSIITSNGFEVSEETETVEGGTSATLESLVLQVQALTIPQEDESVLLSYDLTMWADG